MVGRIRFSGLFVGRFLFSCAWGPQVWPPSPADLRVALATALLWPVLLRQGAVARAAPALAPHLAGRGGQLGHSVCLVFLGGHAIATGLTSILNATVPLFGALVAWLWLGDRINRLRWLGLALGFCGRGAFGVWRAPAGVGVKSDQAGWAIAACPGGLVLLRHCGQLCAAQAHGHPAIATATGSQLGAALALALPTVWFWPAHARAAGLGRHRGHCPAVHRPGLHPVLSPDRARWPQPRPGRHLHHAAVCRAVRQPCS